MKLQWLRLTELWNQVLTLYFLTTSLEYSYLSSSIVKEIAKNGGGLDEFVPQQIIQRIYDKYDIGKKRDVLLYPMM